MILSFRLSQKLVSLSNSSQEKNTLKEMQHSCFENGLDCFYNGPVSWNIIIVNKYVRVTSLGEGFPGNREAHTKKISGAGFPSLTSESEAPEVI